MLTILIAYSIYRHGDCIVIIIGCGLECLNNGTVDENCQTCACDTGYTGLNCSSCDNGYTVKNGVCSEYGKTTL